jgi:hemolysin activation/secretion protein
MLRGRGYLAAVQVPPQRIENGELKFTILMAKIVGIQVRGKVGKAEGLLSHYLKQIQDKPLFNVNESERYLLLARDLPGYDVRMTLRPAGTVPGEVIGEVSVTYTPIEIEANAQNLGSKAVGRWGGLVMARLNGLLGLGDRTSFGGYSTSDFDEQQVFQAGEELKVGHEGLTLAANFTYAWSHPDIGATLNVRSRTLLGNFEAHYPIVRAQAHNLNAAFGFDYINQSTSVSGVALNRDHLRIVYARLEAEALDPSSIASTSGYSAAEPKWRIGGSLGIRKGLNVLSASEPNEISLTRAEGNPQAFVARANGYAEFRPTPKLTISVAPRIQYSPDVVLAYEQVAGGNFTIGRGYDPGSISGDSGIGITNELRIGSLIPQSTHAKALQLYAFLDADWVWNHASDRRALNPQSIYSVGGGVRVAWGEHMLLDVGVAAPLKTLPGASSLSDVRFLINLTARLLPWSRR